MDLWLSLYWTGPIGVGIFLAGLGVLFWGIAEPLERRKEEVAPPPAERSLSGFHPKGITHAARRQPNPSG